MNEQEQLVIMQLIMAGGNAKGSSFEAIKAAKVGDFSTPQFTIQVQHPDD
jgi:PTS system cellobiose-specific IIA component